MMRLKLVGIWIGLFMFVPGGCDSGEPPTAGGALKDEAPSATPVVGVVCASAKDCAEDEYCAVPEGECGREGTCAARPLECERDRPVCGCEGVTYYGGACEAAMSGDNVDFQDECPPPPCTSNAECGPSDYCAKATGDCGGSGTCTPRPVMCSAAIVKVCGCNDVTYTNACKAASAGVNIGHTGKC